LSKIVQNKTWHDDAKPGKTDGFDTEMPHVGIKGFASCHTKHDRAKNDETGSRIEPDELDRVVRAQGKKNGRIGCDVNDAKRANRDEPDEGNGPEKAPNAGGATALHGKEGKQNDERRRNDCGLEPRGNDLQAFYG